MNEYLTKLRKHIDMEDTKKNQIIAQVKKDGETWVPVAFFSYFVEDEEPVLHQLWVSVLGNTRWERIETRDIKEMTSAYRECQAFSESDDEMEI
jgi:hypothetical protein